MALRSVGISAPAKVNLYLRVLHRRPDGFHELDTVFLAVSLHDELLVESGGAPGPVTLTLQGPDPCAVADNLAFRAAEAFRAASGIPHAISVHLEKRIPAGAGLGGGSSDAAAVLRALDHLHPGVVPRSELMAVGAALGSDVPFFLGESAMARGTGRGEVLRPLPPLPEAYVVLVLPPVHVATGPAFAALKRNESAVREALPAPPGSWEAVSEMATNDFEGVIAATHAEVAAALGALRDEGGRPALLSGSGAACFGVFPSLERATAVAGRLEERLGWPAPVVTTLGALPRPGSPGG
ncbi:MAG: 4-(cytidine 5'-diphospho)-2-C-methyl-D-erythritol kinase [Gemmatimonadota bacterium]|nr:4-(cytidine 5'-diphospho)-2-C-methyl-D-erythritol kinase [Gemmatimonadota bacterium]